MLKTSNFKETNILNIYRNESFAGILKRTENGCVFEFDKNFISDNRYKKLTFNINKYKETIKTDGYNLPPFFANLFPEGLRLRALTKYLKTSEDDMFTLFAAVGSDVIGDIYAKNEKKTNSFPKALKLNEINFYELFNKTITDNIPSWEGNDTIAGVQEKISASMITFPLNIASNKSAYILKLNSKDHNNLVENEFYTMKLAKLCGLNTAKFKLVKDKDKNLGLLVTRFDKEFIDNSFVFHHQEDGCQLLERYPADKYRISLNEIAKKILEIASAPQNCILAVLQLYCFSYIIGNGDLHAKNISLIQKNASSFIELSPIYDLICTHIYGDRKMAIKIDGRDDNIKSNIVIDFAKRHGVSEPATKLMINNIVNKIQKNINLIFKISMPEKASNYLKKTIIKRINDLKI